MAVVLDPFWQALMERAERGGAFAPTVRRLERLAEVVTPPAVHPELAGRVAIALAADSPFLCRYLNADPDAFSWAIHRHNWPGPRPRERFADHLRSYLEEVVDEAAWMVAARRFRGREILRIAARDLLGVASVEESTRELSHLAEVALEAACGLARRTLEERYGAMVAGATGGGFAVLGLGKLGAGELNFSSDIDLIYLYASDGESAGGRLGSVSRHEWAVKAARLVTRLIDHKTEDGRLFRVDLRLRPDGDAGPLAFTPQGCANYYEVMGQGWERMMLLRARHCAGDPAVVEAFMAAVEPFVYPRAIDPKLVESVRAVKRQITDQLSQKRQPGFHVKLGTGGIREVEFFAQTIQLLHAGRNPELREANTLALLDRLLAAGRIDRNLRDSQRDDYRFLRRVEHRLQMIEDRQTHLLPTEPGERTPIAQSLGFADVASFDEAIAGVRDRVHLLFQSLFEAEESREALALRERLVREFTSRLAFLDEETARRVFAQWPLEGLSQLDGGAIADGLALHRHVSAAEPVVAHLVDLGFGRYQLRLSAEDRTGLVAVCTGVLAGAGLDIQDGLLFTVAAGRYWGGEAGPRAIDYLTVAPTDGRRLAAAERGEIAERFVDLATRWLRGEATAVRGELNERWVRFIQSRAGGQETRLYPVEMEVDNRSDPTRSVVNLWTEDTPGFLYALSQGLAMRGIDIREIRIRTDGHRVIDRFHLADRHGRKIITAAALHELEVVVVLIKAFTQFLSQAADPALALTQFDALLDRLAREAGGASHFQGLATEPLLAALATVLGSGSHLFDDFLRLAPTHLLPVLEAVAGGAEPPAPPVPAGGSLEERRADLVAWRDAELFRIDCEHLLRSEHPFEAFGEDLTYLAESVVESAWILAVEEVAQHTGLPLDDAGRPVPWAIFGLGKFGGRELSIASDLELMFVYGGDGTTGGDRQIAAGEFFERVVRAFKHNIPARREGIFELDLRLRPHGKDGPLASSLAAFQRYYRADGGAAPFERQALTRLRACCGDAQLIHAVEGARDRFTYGPEPFDRAASLELRRRQIREFTTPGKIHLKYGPGGLAEVEYAVQYLLLEHGHRHPEVRHPNTLAALTALERSELLPRPEAEGLRAACGLLRLLIDALRGERGHAKDLVLPAPDTPAFEVVCRRIRRSPEGLLGEVEATMGWVAYFFRHRLEGVE